MGLALQVGLVEPGGLHLNLSARMQTSCKSNKKDRAVITRFIRLFSRTQPSAVILPFYLIQNSDLEG